MKKLSVLLLALMTIPTYGQSILGALGQHQDSLKSDTPGTKPKDEVKPSTESISSSSNLKCEENDQTSLPLSFVSSLIQKKDGQLSLNHDPREGTLSVVSPDMIGNCSSMLEWKLKKPEIKGKPSYAVELKFKTDDDCTAEGCSYKVAIVENGEFKKYEPMTFKPTMKGFEECLQKSGVVSGGKVVPSAIYSTPISEKFSGLDYSGNVYFLSHGPATPLVKAKHGSFEHIHGCDYYEKTHKDLEQLLTLEDSEKARLDAEAEKLRECKVDEYSKLTDFIEKYESYSTQLGDIRDQLILEAARKSAAAISAGKYTEEDLKVLSDFEKYVVEAKVEKAKAIYEEGLELEGDAKKAKQAELNKVLAEIAALNQKPYFLSAHTQKLISDGRFEEATTMNSFKLVLENYQRLGAKQNGVVITPEVANQKIMSSRLAFSSALDKEKERYEIRTGQVEGNSEYYVSLAKRMRNNIQVRTQNFSGEIQSEYARVQQPNGYCYKYFRNTQKCIQDSVERIQELQALLQHYNKVDSERAAEYDAQAQEYSELEAQGRRYVAAQNGEVPEEEPAAAPVDTTLPPQAQPQPGAYTFDYNPGNAQNQAMMTPNMHQYPTNPYQNQNMFQQQQNPYGYASQSQYGQFGMQQQPYMGMNSGYNFNFNAGFGMGQQQQQNPYMYGQQQQGYWQQPYQSYNMYSMYGR